MADSLLTCSSSSDSEDVEKSEELTVTSEEPLPENDNNETENLVDNILKSCQSEKYNLTDEEKSRLAELMEDVDNVVEKSKAEKIFAITGEAKARIDAIDKKLEILAQRYGLDEGVQNSTMDGEDENAWTDYFNNTHLQQIEKQLEQLHTSKSGNESSEFLKHNNI